LTPCAGGAFIAPVRCGKRKLIPAGKNGKRLTMIELNFHPTRKELRIFSALFLVFFGIVGWFVHSKTGLWTAASILWGLGAAVGVVGTCAPAWVRPVYIVWMVAAYPVGWVVSHVLMGAIYFALLTPIGLILRACGRDPMERKFLPQASTYWIPREKTRDTRRYFRQF